MTRRYNKHHHHEPLTSDGRGFYSGTLDSLSAGLNSSDPLVAAMARAIEGELWTAMEQWAENERERETDPAIIMEALALIQIQAWANLMAECIEPEPGYANAARHYKQLVRDNLIPYAKKMLARWDDGGDQADE
ncbi:hypothetical protein [Mesorhizobium sp. B1-1-8]|uniref:hypothetical protein n=1 Tax=Mesorhizobium sp. B1-1-8 TaxID=2589976 RepID=UPI0011295CEF|nr:hypothetical protein [Mesorhizobium sp. B1-1-8]UCI09975.1 hypothetical protein FJ974_13435 [Mesorhizobium sp. B1-1-8]